MNIECCDFCESLEIRQIFNFESWNLVECTKCGLRWSDPKPNTQRITKLYDKNYFKSLHSRTLGYTNYENAYESKLKTFHLWFNEIEYFLKSGDYLDIGCAFGYSIEVANQRGWNSEGIDISNYACKIARARTNSNIINGDFLRFNMKNKYDLITAWDVLEHTISPSLFFLQANRCLKRDGVLAICTPDAKSFFARLQGKYWFEHKWQEHIYYLSRTNLELYCKKFGFQILKLKFAIKYKTLFDAIARWIGLYEYKRNCKKKFRQILIPYSSFSENFLIARKIK